MKTLRFKSLLVLSILLAVSYGCKKNEKIERNLWKRGGYWNVEYYLIEQESSDDVHFDCGVFTFEKDGTGKYILDIDGNVIVVNFEYELSPTSEKITINRNFTDLEDYSIDWLKNKVELRRTEDGTTETIYLRKDV